MLKVYLLQITRSVLFLCSQIISSRKCQSDICTSLMIHLSYPLSHTARQNKNCARIVSRFSWETCTMEDVQKMNHNKAWECLHGGGGPRVVEVNRLDGVTLLSIKSLILIWSRLHDRWGDPPHVTSPIWGRPPPYKQALNQIAFEPALKPYRKGLLFTHKNSDFGAISETLWSCAKISKGRTIGKLIGGGGGTKCKKHIRARENSMKKIN